MAKSSKPSIIIVGAGLSGCQMAYECSKRGWKVTLVDRHPTLAAQASGNRAAITYPTVSSIPAPISRLAVEGWKYLSEIIMSNPEIRHASCGSLKLLQTSEDENRWTRAIENHGLSADWMKLVSGSEASEISGIELNHPAVWMSRAMWIDITDYCKFLISSSSEIDWRPLVEVNNFGFSSSSSWIETSAGEKIAADRVVFCNAYEISSLDQLSWLPFRKVRGQLAMIRNAAPKLRTILCFDGFITPDLGNGLHQIGATYDRHANDLAHREEDSIQLIEKLKSIMPQLNIDSSSIDSTWIQYRSNVPGMEPLIGNAFTRTGELIQNIFIFAAFASKGLVYIPSGAVTLAKSINGEISSSDLPRFSPKRFIDHK